MRPEEIEKLFKGKIPEWMKGEEKELAPTPPPAEEGVRVQAQSPDQKVAICAVTGSLAGQRFQVFYCTNGQQGDQMNLFLASEQYLDSYDGFVKERKRPRGIRWQITGEVKTNTVLKLYMGLKTQTINKHQGMQYFIADPNVDVASFHHPNERELFIRGRIRVLEEREFEERKVTVPALTYLQAVE